MPYFVPTLDHKPLHLVATGEQQIVRKGAKNLHEGKWSQLVAQRSAATLNRRVAGSNLARGAILLLIPRENGRF